ncbi:acetate--CoA ligase [bacterium]|nr:acetate--CoA ligase [bacterium]
MQQDQNFEDLLHEDRQFHPSEDFRRRANTHDETLYLEAGADPEAFWARQARELEWFQDFETVLDWQPPRAQWFLGGKLNITHNCLDRHIGSWRRNKAAIIWEGENFEQRTLTYEQLHREVCQFANAMKQLGVGRGDRVAIFMPMMIEAAVAMLACARIGAIHSVVFGGFSPESLADRINDSACRLLITADGGYRRGKVLSLKEDSDKAVENCPSIEHIVVVKRPQGEPFSCDMKQGRDVWYHEIMRDASPDCPCEVMDSEDQLFILYTSGTTGKPKGIVHTTGGYSVVTHYTTKYVFDIHDEDIYWCTADIGWITGHSYIVYGPLQAGATVLMYEGAPNWPENDRFWEIVARHRVNVFYTAPTAIRAFMQWGSDLPEKHDLSSLRLLGSVGEPINPEAWIWYNEHIGHNNCPIVDTWWQTETGGIVITTLPGVDSTRPGFAGRPLPGFRAAILDVHGKQIKPSEGKSASGLLALTEPWPSMVRTIWGDDERFVNTYFDKWHDADGNARRDLYFPGDGAKQTADGMFMVLGRIDDVLNVSGHRIGTMEVESALVDHPAVAESAVVGKPHELKGQALVAFVTLMKGVEGTDELNRELRNHVGTKIGAIAKPEEIIFTADLPKTRSGKIMRRLLRDIAEGKAIGDTMTLADPAVVEMLKGKYESKEG